MPNYSIVEYFADHSGYKCGYCKNPNTAFSQGMWAHSMNAEDYQRLIDRGWRRSGQYCYKPTMQKTCCPQYAIRCHANTFKFSKSKKKVAKKMRHFLMNGGENDLVNWKKRCEARNAGATADEFPEEREVCKVNVKMDTTVNAIVQRDAKETPSMTNTSDVNKATNEQKIAVASTSGSRVVKQGKGADPSKQLCRKAKEIRKERKLNKLKEKGAESNETQLFTSKKSEIKTLETLLPHLNPDPMAKQKLEIKLVRVSSPAFERTRKESLKVYQKYQCTIHNDTLADCSEQQWKRFLVDSPINFDSSGPGQGFGTFHNQYWLGEKLIAVGVLDILPNCVSSVYLYYDPDYGFLSLGIYSAISEIALIKKLQADLSSMQYYYMGFYIHSCQKMRYKGLYDPSDLLCPETYIWVPISKCLSTLDEAKYARLNVLNGGLPEEIDEDGQLSNLDEVLCLFRRNIVTYGDYKLFRSSSSEVLREDEDSSSPDEEESEDTQVREYVSFVGRTCAKSMLLYRSSRGF